MAHKANSLSHTKWYCTYHIVFTQKYSQKQTALLMQTGDQVNLKAKSVKGATVANVVSLKNESLK